MSATACAASLALVAGTASAAEQQPAMQAREGPPDERTFRPLAGQNPTTTGGIGRPPAPATCRTSTSCDVVALDVYPPEGLRPSDEYFVRIELSWDTVTVGGDGTAPRTDLNDLNLYVYDDPNALPILRAATADRPERLSLFSPAKPTYQLVVNNASGPNTGYRLRVAVEAIRIDPPQESSEPSATGGSEQFTPPAGGVGTEAPTPWRPASPGPSPAAVGAYDSLLADIGVGAGAAASPLPPDAPLAAFSPAAVPEDERPAVAPVDPVPEPGEPSTLLLLLALGVAPVAIAGAGGAFLFRRRPQALRRQALA